MSVVTLLGVVAASVAFCAITGLVAVVAEALVRLVGGWWQSR